MHCKCFRIIIARTAETALRHSNFRITNNTEMRSPWGILWRISRRILWSDAKLKCKEIAQKEVTTYSLIRATRYLLWASGMEQAVLPYIDKASSGHT
jgi:hypothetical protein